MKSTPATAWRSAARRNSRPCSTGTLTPWPERGGPAPLASARRAEEIPAVARDVEEHGHAAVGLGARHGDELDPGGGHPLVGGFEVVHLEEEPDPPGDLVPDHGRLVRAVRAGQQDRGFGPG